MILFVLILTLSFQSEYTKALKNFQNHNYDRARQQFLKIYKRYPKNSKIDKVLFYLGRLEPNPKKARSYYKRIVVSYPKSRLWGESLLSIAKIDYALGDYDRAINNFYYLIKNSSENSLINEAKHWLSVLGEKAKPGKTYVVQVGAFKSRKNAEKQMNQVSRLGFKPFIEKEGGYFKVRINFSTKEEATSALKALKEKGIEGFLLK